MRTSRSPSRAARPGRACSGVGARSGRAAKNARCRAKSASAKRLSAGLTAGTISLRSGLTAAGISAGTGAAGDNSIALAVAAVASQQFSTASGDSIDGTLSGHFATAVSTLGQSLASAQSRAEDQENIKNLVLNRRDTVSGVSLDEEMADLVRFQRAFQASSRVFSVVDELLDTVVNQLGR